jgi:type IV secretion system protein VirB5
MTFSSGLIGSKAKPKAADSDPRPSAYNPYLAARREWDERYGEFITRARNWRAIALICAVTALLSTAGVVWLSSRSRVVPFVVAVDNLGRPIAAGVAERASVADERLKKAAIAVWIEQLRSVTTDGISQRVSIDRVYAHIGNGTQAQTFISEFYRADPPHKRGQTETVSVEVKSVLPTSDRTFEVEWQETTRDLYGAIKAQDRWKGAFTIAVNPPRDERLARVNPLGIYVTQANWTKVL